MQEPLLEINLVIEAMLGVLILELSLQVPYA